MTEQVYTANRDVHTLLRIYHPEFSQDRHFLAYPIGQFFSAIYRLWDYEKKAIKIDIPAIKECLSSKILNAAPGEVLLRAFSTMEILFENITTYDEFHSEISDKYLKHYKELNSPVLSGGSTALRSLSIYNKYKVPEKDIVSLINAIEEINEIAKYLFDQNNDRRDYIDFGSHFKNLEDFLKHPHQVEAFNRAGDDMTDLLIMQRDGIIDSWAMRFGFAHFKEHAIAILPCISYVDNIGFDGTGRHSGTNLTGEYRNDLSLCVQNPRFVDIIYEDTRIINAFYNRFTKKKRPLWQKAINFIFRKLHKKPPFVIKKKVYSE